MLKKLALMVIAHKSTRKEIGILRKIFEKYDTERNGTCMTRLYQSTHRLRVCLLFKNQDLDGSGSIRYTEFIASALESLGQIDEARLAEAFDLLDGDDSGFIIVQDLADILGEEFPADELDRIIEECDITKDHRISYDEYLSLWQYEYGNDD